MSENKPLAEVGSNAGLGVLEPEAIEVWGIPALLQKAAFEKHCTGDCGKISLAGAINDDITGGLFVCCEAKCPHEKGVVRNYGRTTSFGRQHTVHLRALNEDA
jgi:hypothetical protein